MAKMKELRDLERERHSLWVTVKKGMFLRSQTSLGWSKFDSFVVAREDEAGVLVRLQVGDSSYSTLVSDKESGGLLMKEISALLRDSEKLLQ